MIEEVGVHDILSNVNKFDIYKELFKRQDYGFIVTHEVDCKYITHERQLQALNYLADDTTEELTYGGGAGGAKTWTGCVWLLFLCVLNPRIKAFIARNSLKKIKTSTLITFFKVCKEYGFDNFTYHETMSQIRFGNGSVIDLLDTAYKPSETYEMRFGSLEYTVGWLEEASEQHFDAYDTLKTRVGRHLNDVYEIKPMLFLTCNPAKRWTYSRIYKPARDKKLSPDRVFLQSLVADNPFIESTYIRQLDKISDPAKKKRLKFGLWEYSDEESALYGTYEDILAIFDTEGIDQEKRAQIESLAVRRLSADVARQGSDKAAIFVFASLDGVEYVIDVISYNKSKLTELQRKINELRKTHSIDKDQAVADEDGVGGGVVDNCNIRGFLNGSKPMKENIGVSKRRGHSEQLPKYRNLQTQCAYKLGERIKNRKLKFLCELTPVVQEQIIEELEQLRSDKVDDDNYYYIKSKADIKADLGRSPDYRDALLMNEIFSLKKKRTLRVTAA